MDDRAGQTSAVISARLHDRIRALAGRIPSDTRNGPVAVLASIGAEIVDALPDVVAEALAAAHADGDLRAPEFGARVGRLVVERVAAPVLPEGWTIERVGSILRLAEPSGANAALLDESGMFLVPTAYHSPAVLGAAIAAFVAAAGGAS